MSGLGDYTTCTFGGVELGRGTEQRWSRTIIPADWERVVDEMISLGQRTAVGSIKPFMAAELEQELNDGNSACVVLVESTGAWTVTGSMEQL